MTSLLEIIFGDTISNVHPSDNNLFASTGKLGPHKPVSYNSSHSSVISTDSPKSVRYSCVIDFGDVICIAFSYVIFFV